VVIRPAASLGEVDEAYDLAARVFGPTYPEALKRLAHIRLREEPESPGDVLVAISKEKIVGMVHVLPRDVYVRGKRVKAFGFGHVCIHPSYHGQGHGKQLILHALELARGKKGVLAIVIARRAVDGFYWKYGFVGIDSFAEVTLSGESSSVSSGKRIRYTTGVAPRQLPALARAYEQTYAPLPFTFCRDSRWWSHLGARIKSVSPGVRCVNVYLDRRWLGYFILSQGAVIEAALENRHIELFTQALVRYVHDTLKGPVRLALAVSHPCIEYLRKFAHTMSLRFVWNGGHMVRVLDKERFFDHWPRFGKKGRGQGEGLDVKASASRLNVASHEGARRLVLAAFGAASLPSKTKQTGPVSTASCAVRLHPVWSILDEF